MTDPTPQLDSLKSELIRTDDTFRTLYEEHQDYEHKLDVIQSKSLPSEQDELELKRIKLHKLTLKDKMEAMLRDRLQAHAASS